VGYDDIPMAEFASPPLTTVRSDTISLGRVAMAMLLALLRGEEVLNSPQPVVNTQLVVRESCGAQLLKAEK
jgi:LacI family transcriptional regulator